MARTTDMQTILELECNQCSTTSIIHSTNAGIIIINETSCCLTNKK